MGRVQITAGVNLDEDELKERFVRASGPGGQNVNKVATAVELRFDVLGSPSLTAPVRVRLMRLGGRRLTEEGVLVIRAERFRTQERNREDARERLADLIRRAMVEPKRRIATKPTRGSKERRRDAKLKRSRVKRLRSGRPDLD
jgi:ribosome-associated protein